MFVIWQYESCRLKRSIMYVILPSYLLLSFLGANKPIYAPEPLDVGKILQADVVSDTHTISVTTVSAIDPGLYSSSLTRTHAHYTKP